MHSSSAVGIFLAVARPSAAAVLPYDLAQAHPGGNLRIDATASAVPLPNGMPDQGAEGHRFMGITIYDHLVTWDLSSPTGRRHCARPRTSWRVDPANPKRWIFTIREGVKFHDGKILTAEDVVFSYNRAFKNDAPEFDPRGSAQVRGRMPTLVNWYAEGPNTFIVETRTVDSLVPYGATWTGITTAPPGKPPAATTTSSSSSRSAPAPSSWNPSTSANAPSSPATRTAGCARAESPASPCCHCLRPIPASQHCASNQSISSRRRRPTPSRRCARPASTS